MAETDPDTDPGRIACFFSTSGHSGVDRIAKRLIPALAARGYHVDLLKVRRHGPELEQVPPMTRVIDLGNGHTYGALPAVVRYLRQAKPAAMLSDKDRVNRTALLARKLAGVATRLVLSSGTTISRDLASRGPVERWIQRNSIGKLYRFADAVIVNSRHVADDMASYTGLQRDLITVVPNPAVPEALLETMPDPPDHPWFAPEEPPVILGTGELGPRKDFQSLIRAFAIVRETHKSRLLILGEGGQRAVLEDLIRDLDLGEAAALPGFVPNPFPYMAHAAVFALTSLWEGNALVLPEVLSVGTQVIATDSPGGSREVLDNGKYGQLVPIRDPETLAEAIANALERPMPSAVVREAARPYAVGAATNALLDAMGLPHHCCA